MLIRMKRVLLRTVIVLMLVSTAIAQGPPINTDTPILLGVSGTGVRSFVKVIRKSSQDKDLTVTVSPVVIPYNLSTRFLVGGVFPYFNKDLDTNAGSMSSSGLGDTKLFAKFVVHQIDKRQETIRFVLKSSITFPTGDEDAKPALGVGTTDYSFGVVAGWIKPCVSFTIESVYSLNTTRRSVNYGDRFAYNFALGYRLSPRIYRTYPSPQVNVYLELNGLTTMSNELNGLSLENSGGTTLLLSPGIQYIGGRKWLVEGSIQLPIVENLNGSQLETDIIVSLGTRILLF